MIKIKLPNPRILSTMIVVATSVAFFFWNCSFIPKAFEASGDLSMSSTLPMNHPNLIPLESIEEVSFKTQLMDRHQVYSHMRAILLSPGMSADLIAYIDWVLDGEILARPNDFGGSCDLANPLYTEHPPADCRYTASNAAGEATKGPSVSREASRIQACRRTIGHDETVQHFRAKIQNQVGVTGVVPSKQSVIAIHQLFYLGQTLDSETPDKILALYDEMGSKGESVNDRWRMIFLVFCELPDWQYL